MAPEELIEQLKKFRSRLADDVTFAYDQRGREFGNQRFEAFKRSFISFINKEIPFEAANCNRAFTMHAYSYNRYQTVGQNFWKNGGDRVASYIESLVIDIENDEIQLRDSQVETITGNVSDSPRGKVFNKVFIVHGHDNEIKTRTARFIEKLGFEVVILHEQASRGKTIIEKIEHYTDVDFAIVLYTPDDFGNTAEQAKAGELNPRARQNVIFEHGYLMAKIGRENVVALVSDSLELPNDISGVVYVSDTNWEMDIAKEMKLTGYDVDFNKLF
ncbi:TIR domain-containing protein [Serratia sp. TSA_105.2]|uniref:TIR domain-containing protein n=1 Tax=Serratia sp. TSA_105.2 TaxID=3415660 RepID=UPI004046C255